MAEHEETGSEADSKRTFESASPFHKSTALHREPPILEGQATDEHATEQQVAPGFNTSGVYSQPADASAANEADPLALEAEGLAAEPVAAEPVKEAASPGSDIPPHAAPTPPAPPPVKHGVSPAALLIAAIIGALTGFAGAYAAHLFLDGNPKNTASIDERFNALNTKLAADEKKIDTLGSSNRDALSALDKRIGTAEKSAKDALALATAAQTQTAAPSMAEAPATSQAPGTSPTPVVVAPIPMPDLTPLQSRIDALDTRLTQLETTVNTPKVAERATQEPESKPEPAIANAPSIALVAENLLRKVMNGVPFATELAALDKLGADKTKLTALQPSADKGVATAQALSDELTALTPTLVGNDKPAPPAQEGVFARMLNHATSLVHVRKVGDLSGDDLSARIARVQNALAHDDVEHALQEWAGFPEMTKTASAHWAEAAKTRVASLAEAKIIAADAMSNLTKVKS